MENKEIAAILNEISQLLELAGENPFKVRAYAQGARTIETQDRPAAELIQSGELGRIKGIGATLSQQITELVREGETGFLVPPEKAERYARALPLDPISGTPQSMLDSTKTLEFECGGACAVSTARDYVRFAQMLLNGGILDGSRVLGRKTVEFMTADHLGPEIENNIASIEPHRAGYGFGLGVAVRRQAGMASTIGSSGDYFWNGAFGTSFWVDPKEELVAVVMMHAPGNPEVRQDVRQAVSSFVLQAIEA
jgi:CubicO group peptidase (beta-lactamase class C family)